MNSACRRVPVVCLFLLLSASFCSSPCLSHGQSTPSRPEQIQPNPNPQPEAGSARAAASVPAKQAYSLPPEKLAKAIAFTRIRHFLGFAGSLWGLAALWLLLATRAAAAIEARIERTVRWRWLQGPVFFALLLALLDMASFPLSVYGHCIALEYGVSVQGWGSWLAECLKSLGLTLLIGAPVLALFNWIVRRFPRRFWLVGWAVALPLIVLSTLLEPLAEPIFNKFEPLSKSNSALVARLEEVVARTGTHIPPERIFLMKASAKTNGFNAYVTGIGATKRYVMWDTVTDRLPDDEILFIFGHESGHYVLNHIPLGLAASAVFLFFLYWCCAGVGAWLVRRWGAGWGIGSLSSRAGFLVLVFTLSAASFVLEPLSNGFSRHLEHEADIYGQEAIHGLVADPQKTAVAAFNRLGEASLDDPNPSPFIEFWSYGHPSVQTRANFAAHYDPWTAGGRPKFFAK
jgi:STE24 endopeptidase